MIYLDTSALLKLVQWESESKALRSWLDSQPNVPWVSSRLLRIELLRSVRRNDPYLLPAAYGILGRIDMMSIDRICAGAESIGPAMMRSLDSIHLATGCHLKSALKAFVAYDKRLLKAASVEGLPVISPT
ncbi:MAG: type II toxin-antitoxin system VapC family toxin [Candidatus Dormibacteraceae bacterium]